MRDSCACFAPDSEAEVYAISCQLGLTKIGVAADAEERRRAMQVGSPVPLELAGSYRYPRAQDAYAVAAELRRQLAARHEHGGASDCLRLTMAGRAKGALQAG